MSIGELGEQFQCSDRKYTRRSTIITFAHDSGRPRSLNVRFLCFFFGLFLYRLSLLRR